MIDCLIIGDSIAIGIHQFKQECQVIAKSGINSWQFNKTYNKEFLSGTVIISLGSNDHQNIKTSKELENLRSRILSYNKVFWILPANKSDIQNIVQEIANKHGDQVISITKLQADKIHPSWTGYREIAEKTK